MAFPCNVSDCQPDERGLYLIQETAVRSRVLPLFGFDPQNPDQRPTGFGTAFRVDPWSRCVTAFHVSEELFDINPVNREIVLSPNLRLCALEMPELGYGLMRVPREAWRPIAEAYALYDIDESALVCVRLRNLTELIVLRIRPSAPTDNLMPYYPLDLRNWHPRVGERVMALGYAGLDIEPHENASPIRPIDSPLYASIGEIIDIEPADPNRRRSWPIIRVNANWPGGMSGGPVFNENGHVIGIVSTGCEGMGGASATFFSGWRAPEQTLGSIDPDRPGYFLCWGAFNESGQLVYSSQDRAQAESIGLERNADSFGLVSIDPQTEEWVRL